MIEINNLPVFESDIIKADDVHVINVKKPLKYSEIPKIESILEKHSVTTPEKIIEYFGEIKDSRIMMINGVPMDGDCSCLYCDYCNTSIEKDKYYYCYDCHLDMCSLCHSETSEEIATKNGAKNYHNRKDKLEKCHNNHQLIKRDKSRMYATCDICNEGIILGQSYFNTEMDYDMCLECSKTDEGQDKMKENNLQLSVPPCEMNQFGSMLDWVPIVIDDEYNMILINLNPESSYHQKYALSSVDDHGRQGYYTIWKDTTLDELVNEINEILEEQKKEEEKTGKKRDVWDAVYNMPIKIMMNNRHMPYHYG